jgi:iron complex outermembrane recepter protein
MKALSSAVAVGLLTISTLVNAQNAVAIHIASASVADAVNQWALQTGFRVVWRDDASTTAVVPKLDGNFTPRQALDRLLHNTHLQAEFRDANTAVIGRADLRAAVGPSSVRVANSTSAVTYGDSVESGTVEEVLVTAQKREERLQDVPIPVSVVDAQALVDNNQLRIDDYYSSIPGFTYAPATGAGQNQLLAFRGITTSSSENRTVAIVIDDVPYGATSQVGASGLAIPDMDPSDLARVEVLRGPQGTLYGASSLGGLLKFVTLDPSVDRLSGQVQAGTNSVRNGAELGYSVRGSVNVPVTDTLAVRMSAFTRLDPGYIDNPVLGVDGVNEAHVSGGHFSALWHPSEDLSLKLTALVQSRRANGLNDVDLPINGYTGAPLSGLQQNYLRGIGGGSSNIQAYTATLTAKIGAVNLTSVSGYNRFKEKDSLDFTYGLGGVLESGIPGSGFDGFGVSGTPLFTDQDTHKYVQEIRLSSTIGERLDWLFGVFYTHESTNASSNFGAEDPATGAIVGQFAHIGFPSEYQEYAAFTDLTYHFTDNFDVQIGARESRINQSLSEQFSGPYAPLFLGQASPFNFPQQDTDATPFTYLLTPRYRLSPDLMVYARLASGYRPGNANLYAGANTPSNFRPDKTQSWELGTKGDFLSNKLSFDASIYYINWKDIQLNLLNEQTFLGYIGNGGTAKSEGVELSVDVRPLPGLTFNTWITYDDAALTEDLPPSSTVYGLSGYRLPYSSRVSGGVSAEQTFPLGSNARGFVSTSVNYVGNRLGEFNSTPPTPPQRQYYSPYAKVDLRLGARFESWAVSVYANNVMDKRAVLGGGITLTPPYAVTYIQPRTLGLNVSKEF